MENSLDPNIISVKEIRIEIQSTIHKVKACLGNPNGGRERALAITKLQEARMWLGMALQEMGEPNPYPTGCDPTTDKIDPPTDVK